jgi:hypothetical protein
MNIKKPHVSGIIIYLPMNLAHGIFRESGNLPVHDFPCILRLAESIGEALNVGHAIGIEENGNVKLAIVSQDEKKTAFKQKHKR